MALTGDQRALLKLVLERGQSYEDIAGLLGGSAEEVRERARSAIAAAAGSELDRSANVTDFLLGQADPISRADTVRHLSRDAADRDRAERALLALEAIAPNASLPQLPETRTAKQPRRAKPEKSVERGDGGPLGKTLEAPQRRLVALIGATALAIVVIVVLIAGGGGDGDSGIGEEIDPDFVRVELEPAAGAKGRGVAVIGQTDDDQPFIELDLVGLGEIGPNSTYVLWMLTRNSEGIPVAPLEVSDGEFHDRMPLLSPADIVAAFSQSIVVSVMSREELQRSLEGLVRDFTQTEEGDEQANLPVTRYRARTILQGEIPTLADVAGQAEDAAESQAPPAQDGSAVQE